MMAHAHCLMEMEGCFVVLKQNLENFELKGNAPLSSQMV